MRHRQTLFGLAVITVAAALALASLRFMPLATAEAPVEPIRVTPVECFPVIDCEQRPISPPLDAFGMAAAGLERYEPFFAAEDARLHEEWYQGLIMHDHWLRIGRCEQPGGGYGGINWSASGSTSDGFFQGGLGIAAGLYQSIAGHSALLDPPFEQMRVATIAYGRVGAGAWACK